MTQTIEATPVAPAPTAPADPPPRLWPATIRVAGTLLAQLLVALVIVLWGSSARLPAIGVAVLLLAVGGLVLLRRRPATSAEPDEAAGVEAVEVAADRPIGLVRDGADQVALLALAAPGLIASGPDRIRVELLDELIRRIGEPLLAVQLVVRSAGTSATRLMHPSQPGLARSVLVALRFAPGPSTRVAPVVKAVSAEVARHGFVAKALDRAAVLDAVRADALAGCRSYVVRRWSATAGLAPLVLASQLLPGAVGTVAVTVPRDRAGIHAVLTVPGVPRRAAARFDTTIRRAAGASGFDLRPDHRQPATPLCRPNRGTAVKGWPAETEESDAQALTPAGLVFGMTDENYPLLIRLFGAVALRGAVFGSARFARLLVLRVAAAGGHVWVRTSAPARWQEVVGSVPAGRITLAAPGDQPPAELGEPGLLVADAGVPADPAWSAACRPVVTIAHRLTAAGLPALRAADFALLEGGATDLADRTVLAALPADGREWLTQIQDDRFALVANGRTEFARIAVSAAEGPVVHDVSRPWPGVSGELQPAETSQ